MLLDGKINFIACLGELIGVQNANELASVAHLFDSITTIRCYGIKQPNHFISVQSHFLTISLYGSKA